MLGTLVYSALDVTFNTVCWTVNKTFSGVYGLYNWYYDENTDENTDENPDKNTDKNPDKNTENGDSESILSNPKRDLTKGQILAGFCRSFLGKPMSSIDDIGFQRIKYFLIDRINQQDEKIKTLEAELIELQNMKK